MTADMRDLKLRDDWPETVRRIRARTPARILVGRAGAAYRTDTQLDLRQAHAAARDAVRAELEMEKQFGAAFVKQWGLFEVCTQAQSKNEYLLQPNLGRIFHETSRHELMIRCARRTDFQVVIGDGLSVTAIYAQVPKLLPLLWDGAKVRGWTLGQVFVIRHCRVGIVNEIGELLSPRVVVLLIGERPGLATAESLSAYMAYHPRKGQTDADRNLISNIHARGLSTSEAARRILELAAQMISAKSSGIQLRAQPSISSNW